MTAPNRTGRPRDPELRARVIAAGITVLAEDGAAGFAIDSVAAAAGVGKASIYRRWDSKVELLADIAGACQPDIDWPDGGGTLAGDLEVLLTAFTTGETAAAAVALLSSLPYDRELRYAWGAGPAAALSVAIGTLAHRALARGTTSVHLWSVPVGGVVRRLQHDVLTRGSTPTPIAISVYVDSLVRELLPGEHAEVPA